MHQFFGVIFISTENTDILFEVKAVLCFYFLCIGRYFSKKCQCSQDRIVSNRFEVARVILKNAANLHQSSSRRSRDFASASQLRSKWGDERTRRGRLPRRNLRQQMEPGPRQALPIMPIFSKIPYVQLPLRLYSRWWSYRNSFLYRLYRRLKIPPWETQ